MVRLRTAPGAVSDRTLNRILLGLVAALVIGLPTIALVYVLDRGVDPGLPVAERAIAAGEEAVRSEPNKLSNRLGLALAYEAAGRHTDAITQYTEVLKAEPVHRTALLGRADAYVTVGDLDAAARDFQALVDATEGGEMAVVDPQREAAFYGLGSIALAQGRPADAAVMLANALTINRTDADALNLLGTALIRTGDTDNAITALRAAIALVPTGWCEPYAQLTDAYTADGNTPGAQYGTGMVAMCEKRAAEAVQALTPLIEGPFGMDALIGLGLAAEQTGDREAAIDYYSRAYAADPADFDAVAGLNRLGADAPGSSQPAPIESDGGS
jgi:tetratricopeptide (TPR) repeat protein